VSFDQFGKVDCSFNIKLQNRQTNINSLVTSSGRGPLGTMANDYELKNGIEMTQQNS